MSTSHERAMVLPLDDRAALFRWTGERLEQREGVLVPRAAPWAASIEADLLCYAERNEIHLLRGVFSGERAPPQVINVSGKDYTFHCLALKGGVLFAGGRCGDEVVGWLDTESSAPAWRGLEVPNDVRRWGKSVDSFVLDGDRLIGLDDILMPKWWLVYDASDPRAARLTEHPTLATHSTYEVFHHAALAHQVIATVSTSMNHGRVGVYLSLYDRRTLAPIGGLDAAAGPFSERYNGQKREAMRDFVHVDCRDELLIVSAGAEGAGLLDLREIDTAPFVMPPNPDYARVAAERNTRAATLDSKVRWRKREGFGAVRAYFCDAAHVAIAWQNAYKQCWVELVEVRA